MSSRIEEITYPRLIRRIQAVLIDGIVLPMAFIGALVIITPFQIDGWIKLSVASITLVILEPGLVSITGATIGHHLIGLRVQDAKSSKNLDIFRATVRFVIKTLLGLPSLIFVLITKRHQAIHDLVSRSVVVIKDPAKTPEYEALPERITEEAEYIYPSKLRRILMIVFYNLVGFIVLGILATILLSENCLNYDTCNSKDRVYDGILGVCWLMVIAVSLVLCWKGRLWGCKRKNRKSN